MKPNNTHLLFLGLLATVILAIPARGQFSAIVDGEFVRTKADAPCLIAFSEGAERYIDCGNGTVYDAALGIFWLKDATCDGFGTNPGAGSHTFALFIGKTMQDGADCDADLIADLRDRSEPGDWRLPTVEEWQAVADLAAGRGCSSPAMLNNDGLDCYTDGTGSSFEGIETNGFYWATNADAADPTQAVVYDMKTGTLAPVPKSTGTVFIWPVRDGDGSPSQQGTVKIGEAVVDTREEGPCHSLLSVAAERYVSCGNGTVLDLVTGLIWMADPLCLGNGSWVEAMLGAALLEDGDCGAAPFRLEDGSEPGDWRLPTAQEWVATMARGVVLGCTLTGPNEPPALTNRIGDDCLAEGPIPFLRDPQGSYWSSTAIGTGAGRALTTTGGISLTNKPGSAGVWAVRER